MAIKKETINSIRSDYYTHTLTELAKKYGYSRVTINKIIKNRIGELYYDEGWIKPDKKSGEANTNAKLSASDKEEIRKILESKPPRGTITRLAKKYNVTRACIYKYKSMGDLL